MRILLIGRTGQIGSELEADLRGFDQVIAVDRAEMDLANLRTVRDVIRTVKPTIIINAAAYTNVDQAESEQQLAMRINGEAPTVMAEEAKTIGAAIVHFSSDYVFDGSKQGAYKENDAAHPLNVYGATKLAGDEGVQAAGVPYLIIRTSWIYSRRGRNFFTTIQRLAKENDEIHIINDQRGAPTWSRIVSTAIADIVMQTAFAKDAFEWLERHTGIYHLAAQGSTTWYGFAEAIVQQLSLAKKPVIRPIKSHEYHAIAERPMNSVLNCGRWIDTFGKLPTWDDALKLCILGGLRPDLPKSAIRSGPE